jgi:lactoylglutathione lyase
MIRFAHTNIITDDWKKLSDFYIKVFDCKPILPERNIRGEWLDKSTKVKGAHIKGIHLALPGHEKPPTLEIFQYEKNENKLEALANRKGFGHIAFQVENVEEALDKVLKFGGSRLGEIVQTEIEGAGGITFVYAKDPDGNIIELQKWEPKSAIERAIEQQMS